MNSEKFDKLAMMNRVFTDSRATGSQRFLLAAMASFAWKSCIVYPSQETLASMTKLSKRHIRNLLRDLEKMGELRIVKAGDGRGNHTRYELCPGGRPKPLKVASEPDPVTVGVAMEEKAEIQSQQKGAKRRKLVSSFVEDIGSRNREVKKPGKIEERRQKKWKSKGDIVASMEAACAVRYFIESEPVTPEQVELLEGNIEVARKCLSDEEFHQAEAILRKAGFLIY